MAKPLIIIADTNKEYLEAIEYKFLQELGDAIDLELITNPSYLDEYFSKPVTAEILIISEDLYNPDIKKHSVNNVYLLTEKEIDDNATSDLSINCIFKYKSLVEIYTEIINASRHVFTQDSMSDKGTRVIAFYSPIGGSGKTSLSIGTALALSKLHQRVLYISMEKIQNYQMCLKDKNFIDEDAYRAILNNLEHPYANLKMFMHTNDFSYFQPFGQSLDMWNIDERFYERLIQDVVSSGEFDYILIDLESGYDVNQLSLLNKSDMTVFVVKNDAMSEAKLSFVLNNISFSTDKKYTLICNKSDSSDINISKLNIVKRIFIPFDNSFRMDLDYISSITEITNLAKTFLALV